MQVLLLVGPALSAPQAAGEEVVFPPDPLTPVVTPHPIVVSPEALVVPPQPLVVSPEPLPLLVVPALAKAGVEAEVAHVAEAPLEADAAVEAEAPLIAEAVLVTETGLQSKTSLVAVDDTLGVQVIKGPSVFMKLKLCVRLLQPLLSPGTAATALSLGSSQPPAPPQLTKVSTPAAPSPKVLQPCLQPCWLSLQPCSKQPSSPRQPFQSSRASGPCTCRQPSHPNTTAG